MHSQAKKMKKERKSKGVPQVQSTKEPSLDIIYQKGMGQNYGSTIIGVLQVQVLNNSLTAHNLEDF